MGCRARDLDAGVRRRRQRLLGGLEALVIVAAEQGMIGDDEGVEDPQQRHGERALVIAASLLQKLPAFVEPATVI